MVSFALTLRDLDIVFISYDEPMADQHFDDLVARYPRARRVHGVKGFDAAHKAAARRSEGDYVITVDGDNAGVDPSLLDETVHLDSVYRHCVIAFSALNPLNGLIYGNGGIKVWPRQLVLAMRTHENADSQKNATEFCWDLGWYKINRLGSEVQMTRTPFQAFRGGFREGIKILTPDGTSPREALPALPLKEAFRRHVWSGSAARLSIWCSVGADVDHGLFAIYGARLGAAMLLFDDLDRKLINDYEAFQAWWREVIAPRLSLGVDHDTKLWQEIRREGDRLRRGLDLPIADLDAEGSHFYKAVKAPLEDSSGPIRPIIETQSWIHGDRHAMAGGSS